MRRAVRATFTRGVQEARFVFDPPKSSLRTGTGLYYVILYDEYAYCTHVTRLRRQFFGNFSRDFPGAPHTVERTPNYKLISGDFGDRSESRFNPFHLLMVNEKGCNARSTKKRTSAAKPIIIHTQTFTGRIVVN